MKLQVFDSSYFHGKIHVKELIKKKGYKLYAKWKGYDNYFYTWIKEKTYYKSINIFLTITAFR